MNLFIPEGIEYSPSWPFQWLAAANDGRLPRHLIRTARKGNKKTQGMIVIAFRSQHTRTSKLLIKKDLLTKIKQGGGNNCKM
jgi:hypothetical protein